MEHPDNKKLWWEYHKKNPDVYALFERFSFQAIERGRDRLSAWLIMNRIRWETNVMTTGEDFKVSNNHIAYYARLFMALNPEHSGFFTVKKMKED